MSFCSGIRSVLISHPSLMSFVFIHFQQREAPRFLAHFKGRFIIHKVGGVFHKVAGNFENVSVDSDFHKLMQFDETNSI